MNKVFKLNNKGFAFSTVLYGILAMIIILLFLIFNIMRGTKNENYYFASAIEKRLNACLEEEMALEACYTTGGISCDHTSYYTCLGIKEEIDDTKYPTFKEKLSGVLVNSGSGLYKDTVDSNRYVYRGDDVNNYIKYDNKLWRIIAMESDGSLKIMLVGYDVNYAWDSSNTSEWSSSTVNNYLNTNFYQTLTDTSRLVKRSWNVGRMYLDVGDITLKQAITFEEREQFIGNNSNYGLVGLISVSDYAKASLNATCSNNVINNVQCSSWVTGYTSWTISATNANEAVAIIGNKTIQNQALTVESAIKPVVFLNANLTIRAGRGTSADPYIMN